jgi:hypothetical protein
MWGNLSSDLLIMDINKEKMFVTQRQGVITCIPKEGKSKEFLKKWRSITLLNST